MFKAAYGTAEDWAHAAQACVDSLGRVPAGANLGFLYVSDLLAEDIQKIHAYLQSHTGVKTWVGSIGIGVLANSAELMDTPAVAVLVGTFPEGGFQVVPSIKNEAADFDGALSAWLDANTPLAGVVHGDPENGATPDIILELAERTGTFLLGGVTSSRDACHQIAHRATGGGVSGVLFSSEVPVATGLSQGCIPLGPSHLISDCIDNVIVGLDGRKALDVFVEDIGEELALDLRRLGGVVHAALPIEGPDTGDYMVRELIGIDPARGWISVAAPVQPGERILFVRRDPDSARADLIRALDGVKGRLAGPPRGALYFSCVARGENMFGAPGAEMAVVRDVFGDVPLAGFFAGGEISNGRLYGYTGVIVLFL